MNGTLRDLQKFWRESKRTLLNSIVQNPISDLRREF